MEMSLTCLKLAGMFPRVIERDWKIIDGRTCSRAGKVSFACLVFSVLFAFIRFAFFVHVLFVEVPDMYGGETMFDRLGSRIWDCSYFVWELVTVISVFFKHKAIKSCCNKVFILMHLYGISPKEVKAPISQKSLLNPIVGIFFYIIGYIFSSHAFSYVQSTLLVIQVLSSLIFVSFCRTLNQYLALLQCKVHSIDQAVLSKLQARPLYHSKHFLNILMRKDSIKCLYFQPSLGRTTNLIKENRNPELLIHLRLQEVIDILSREFMDSVGPGILIQLTNSIVTLTLGSYFMIKAASTHTLNTNGSGYFALYALYIALAFITMAGPQSIEVSIILPESFT